MEYDYNYIKSRLYKVFEQQGRPSEVEKCLDNLINDYGFEKASQLVMKIYNQYFD